MGESANWENREQVWYEPGRTWEGQREAIRIAGGVRGPQRTASARSNAVILTSVGIQASGQASQ